MDVGKMVGAVTRWSAPGEIDGRPARVVVAQRRYAGTIDEVWDALTNAERIPRWFLPVSGDLRLGGRYQFQGNAGGEITACDPPRHVRRHLGMRRQVSWLTVRARARPATATRSRARARRACRRRVLGSVRSGRGGRRLGPRR